MSILEVRNLSKAFGGLQVTDDVSLTLNPGDRVALIGPNGAGKTTFVNLVTGHLKPNAGQVLIDGQDMTRASPTARVHAGLVRSFQVTRLFPDMTPEEHVALAILQRMGRAERIFADYRAMPDVMDEVFDILQLLQLSPLARTAVRDIAYGQQRLLEIALAMALRPRVLLLDEPAAGVPASDTVLIEKALDQLPPALAVLMIEHDMDFVFRFARRVVVLAAGRLIFDGTPAEVAADPQVREAYLGSYAE
ncbi:putative branched-chain amino acid uptake ABC transporter ATP-binding protein (plasmid) [Ketogulonicigenium vulgare Y25]|uniref:ABC transporter, nucleotide binding/ATPase protein (Branched chain amino acid) n=1 Tax=Ketogulonicigenium vulgare (strain WSH-001) TaxID=759362 RepID=F9YBX3_KETVW|nr:ABC transporter ATP-binding protein [Ketogulonicigenium vulgare]ADO44222.1 putative branched-chain amino acid uptake ABC transporter ATP-binding protein [Ketogulonicigenium vulgare Y25]AEM42875.1 ABC transporter, nucleotide binding/ATPase protein (Branched chain amino acid) [Ketogulonicigenium vulgare WSH-001]ALJ82699.1 ABC transporter ATP-binding protein [Ketogulonicigenium vulgare]